MNHLRKILTPSNICTGVGSIIGTINSDPGLPNKIFGATKGAIIVTCLVTPILVPVLAVGFVVGIPVGIIGYGYEKYKN